MRCRTLPRWSLRLVIIGVTACATADHGVERSITRSDSLGVAIVTSAVPVHNLTPVFSVSPQPRLRVGAVEGTDEVLFSDIGSIVRLDDGRIAIANGTPPEIRLFGATGEFLGRLGRSGRGPGEFQYLERLTAGRGDTLLAVNAGFPNFQLMRFDVRSGYIDMMALSRDSLARALDTLRLAEGIREFLRNGSVVLTVADARDTSGEPRRPSGELYRPMSPMVWVSADYGRSRVLGTFGEIEQMIVEVENRTGRPRMPLVPPNARTQVSAVGGQGTRFCVAPNDGPVAGPDLRADIEGWKRFRVFSPTGELRGTADLPPVTVHDLGPDYLLGVSQNDDGVEFVVAYHVSPMGPR